MTILTESRGTAAFLKSEANGSLSRDVAVVASGADLLSGAVLGRILSAAATAVAAGGNTGNGAMGAVAVGAGVQVGAYTLKITKAAADAGDFEVIDPQGDVVGVGTVGQAFAGGGLSFTLADGGTDFAAGDTITITVAAGSGKYVKLNPAGTDGRQIAAAVLYSPAAAASADVRATIIARLAELKGELLVWPAGITTPQKAAAIAQLATASIIVR